MKPNVAVLAGGESRRMGRDKAAIAIDGESMLLRIVGAANGAGLQVIVIGREPTELPQDLQGRVDALPDDATQRGPLGGLATALRVAKGAPVILCGCDLPRITAECFQWLLNEALILRRGLVQAVIPQTGGRAQPLFACYSGELLPLVLRHLAVERLAMHQMLSEVKVHYIDVPQHLVAALQDVDTPAELEQLNDAGSARLK